MAVDIEGRSRADTQECANNPGEDSVHPSGAPDTFPQVTDGLPKLVRSRAPAPGEKPPLTRHNAGKGGLLSGAMRRSWKWADQPQRSCPPRSTALPSYPPPRTRSRNSLSDSRTARPSRPYARPSVDAASRSSSHASTPRTPDSRPGTTTSQHSSRPASTWSMARMSGRSTRLAAHQPRASLGRHRGSHDGASVDLNASVE